MNKQSKPVFEPDGKNSIHDGIEHEPGGGKALIDPTDTVLLLLDHQSGLFQNVKDISVAELRANTTALAKLAALVNIPVITTVIEAGPAYFDSAVRQVGEGIESATTEVAKRDAAPYLSTAK